MGFAIRFVREYNAAADLEPTRAEVERTWAMGLNRVQNPAKLRQIAYLIKEPATYAAARFFADQRDLLVVGVSGRTYCVNLKTQTAEPYVEEGKVLTVYRNAEGVACGIQTQGVDEP